METKQKVKKLVLFSQNGLFDPILGALKFLDAQKALGNLRGLLGGLFDPKYTVL